MNEETNMKEHLQNLISCFVANINNASQAVLELSLNSPNSQDNAKKQIQTLTDYIEQLQDAEIQCFSSYPLPEDISPLFNQIVTSIIPRTEMSLNDLNAALTSPPQDYALLKEINEITGGVPESEE